MLVKAKVVVFDVEGLTVEKIGLDSPILLDVIGNEELG